jgi:hypothetical protein
VARQTQEIPIDPRYGPRISVVLEWRGESANCRATIDGAAHRTLLPMEIAKSLGMGPAHLRPNVRRFAGPAGSRFRTWSALGEVRARVGAEIDGAPEFLGPEVVLDPAFFKPKRQFAVGPARAAGALLGRIDFLSVFEVSVHRAIMRLSWDEADGED